MTLIHCTVVGENSLMCIDNSGKVVKMLLQDHFNQDIKFMALGYCWILLSSTGYFSLSIIPPDTSELALMNAVPATNSIFYWQIVLYSWLELCIQVISFHLAHLPFVAHLVLYPISWYLIPTNDTSLVLCYHQVWVQIWWYLEGTGERTLLEHELPPLIPITTSLFIIYFQILLNSIANINDG